MVSRKCDTRSDPWRASTHTVIRSLGVLSQYRCIRSASNQQQLTS